MATVDITPVISIDRETEIVKQFIEGCLRYATIARNASNEGMEESAATFRHTLVDHVLRNQDMVRQAFGIILADAMLHTVRTGNPERESAG